MTDILLRRLVLALTLALLTACSLFKATNVITSPPPEEGGEQGGEGGLRSLLPEDPQRFLERIADQDVNYQGEYVVKRDGAGLVIAVDDFYYEPTLVAGPPGATVTLHLVNQGRAGHTFTLPEQGVNVDLSPRESAEVEVEIPTEERALVWRCSYHGNGGEIGALYRLGEPGEDDPQEVPAERTTASPASDT